MSREVTGTDPGASRSSRRRRLRVVLVPGAVVAVLVASAGLYLATAGHGGGTGRLAQLGGAAAAPLPSATVSIVGEPGPAGGRRAAGGAAGGPGSGLRREFGPGVSLPPISLALTHPVPDRAQLGRVRLQVVIRNATRSPRQLAGVSVIGLGVLLLDDSRAIATTPITLPPFGSVSLPATLDGDCSARYSPQVQAGVTLAGPGGGQLPLPASTPGSATLVQALAPICPEPVPGMAVGIVGAQPGPGASVLVRLVNYGFVTPQVVITPQPELGPVALGTDPALPLIMSPGQAIVVRLLLTAPVCPTPTGKPGSGTGGGRGTGGGAGTGSSDAAQQAAAGAAAGLGLEARMAEGYTGVTGWPTALIQAAARSAVRMCG